MSHDTDDVAVPAASIPFTEAVIRAKTHMAEVFDVPRQHLLLEELEARDDAWLVTLSMPSRIEAQRAKATLGSAMSEQLLARGLAGKREFKIIEVRRANGAIASLRVRSLLPSY